MMECQVGKFLEIMRFIWDRLIKWQVNGKGYRNVETSLLGESLVSEVRTELDFYYGIEGGKVSDKLDG